MENIDRRQDIIFETFLVINSRDFSLEDETFLVIQMNDSFFVLLRLR